MLSPQPRVRSPGTSASQGSATSSSAIDSDRSAIPAPARPSSTPSIAIAAIAAARRTLGSGVTSRTNPPRATRPLATRTPRRAPIAAAAANASPTTSAQFAPDTAVRCDSEDSFICASSARRHRRRVADGEPGHEARPGSGRPADRGDEPLAKRSGRREQPARRGHDGQPARCANGQHLAVAGHPRTRGSARLDHGADVECATTVDVAGIHLDDDRHRDAMGDRSGVDPRGIRIEGERAVGAPLDLSDDGRLHGERAAAPDREVGDGVARGLGECDMGCCRRRTREAEDHDSDHVPADPASAACCGPRPHRRPAPRPTSTHSTAARPGAASGTITVTSAHAHTTAATGTSRRVRRRGTVTPSRDRGATRASCRRSRARPGGPRRS